MQQIRKNLFIIVLILISLGIVMIYSSSAIYAYERYQDSAFFLKRHLAYLLAGIFSAFGVMSVDYRKMRGYSRHILFLAALLLIAVLLVGREIGGARRWFSFGVINFQPSEFAKLAFIIYLSDLLARKHARIGELFYGFVPAGVVTGFMAVLVLVQPDLGTAVTIMLIALSLFFASGMNIKHLASTALVCLPLLLILIAGAPYRRRRIMAFLAPWDDPRGVGFQVIQSFLALGSGGLLGVGLGRSSQKLFYLPAAHTDFIFSIIGEELGLIGTASVLVLFALFIWQGMRISFRSEDLFGKLISLGITSMIAIQVIINIGASTGSMPTKGLPLPFISYGGSSLVFNLIAFGLLLNVAKNSKEEGMRA
ncbi:MAG: putative lipid II flippase FtsW [Candidatus Omnitrophota bacterium]